MPSGIIECCIGQNLDPDQKQGDVTISVIPKESFKKVQTLKNGCKKEFIARDSALTEVFNTVHGATLYRLTMILSLMTVLSSGAVDIIQRKPLNVGQEMFWFNIKGIPLALASWCILFSMINQMYWIFILWATKRTTSSKLSLWDLLFLIPTIFLTGMYITFAPLAIYFIKLPPVCAFGLLMEQIRFLTKFYAFLRSKIPDVVAAGKSAVPMYSDFLIFLLMPTLVYKDKFPRSSKIRWRLVTQHSLELIWCGLLIGFCMSRVHAPGLAGFRSVWVDVRPLFATFAYTLVPSTMILLLGFYCYFHCFCNLLAECTGLQDRMFYKDWWNSTSFQAFFTSWNTIVQDWLYHYIYLDAFHITGSKTIAAGAVFFVSGIVHEYVLSFFFKFFFPVLIIVFVGVGLILKSIPSGKVSPLFGNLMMWCCIPFGCTIITISYMTEYFARINCPFPPETSPWEEFFVPRSWTCPVTF